MKAVDSPWPVRSCQPKYPLYLCSFLINALLSAVLCVWKFFSNLLSGCLNSNVLNQCYLKTTNKLKYSIYDGKFLKGSQWDRSKGHPQKELSNGSLALHQ